MEVVGKGSYYGNQALRKEAVLGVGRVDICRSKAVSEMSVRRDREKTSYCRKGKLLAPDEIALLQSKEEKGPKSALLLIEHTYSG